MSTIIKKIKFVDITPPPMVEDWEAKLENYLEMLSDEFEYYKRNPDLEEEEDTAFGTEYHDGSGFDDCDSENTGWRTCKEIADKSKWCSECVYLNNIKDIKIKPTPKPRPLWTLTEKSIPIPKKR